MAEAVHRIGRMSISCEAPRGAPARQAAADRLARRLRRDITLALARVLDNDTRHIVIDRLDCPALSLFEATDSAAVGLLSAHIAGRISGAGHEAGVWVFESEADFVAAFVAACVDGRKTAAPEWRALRSFAGPEPLESAVILADARNLDLVEILKCLSDRIDLPRLFLETPARIAAGILARICPEETAAGPEAEVLAAAAESLIAAADLPLPSRAALLHAIRNDPVDWRDRESLADAVARAVGTVGLLPGDPGPGTPDTAGATGQDLPRLAGAHRLARGTPAVERALRRLDWLDTERLRVRLGTSGLDVAPPRRIVQAVAALSVTLHAVARDIASQPSEQKPMAAKPLAVLWQVLFRALYPAWAGDPLPPRLIRDVLGGHPIRSDVQGWAALRELWSDTLAGVSISAQPAAHRETPKPRPHPHRAPGPPNADEAPAATRPSLHIEWEIAGPADGARLVTPHHDHDNAPASDAVHSGADCRTEAAGLSLLWRTLIDLNFNAAIRSLVEDGEASADRLASALWTLALSASGLPPETAARDSGVRAFVRLRPGEDAPDRLAPHDEAALAQRLGTGPVFRTRSAAETLDATVLIAFTYWLRGFELSTPDFVATRFLRRPGTLSADGKWLHIRLAPLAFDMVLGRAGYLDPVLLPDWLGGLRVSFEIERTP